LIEFSDSIDSKRCPDSYNKLECNNRFDLLAHSLVSSLVDT
jgi:hypothetical protein